MRIFVGNIPNEIQEEDIRDIFAAFGEIDSVQIVYDKLTGESRRFGYVQMPNEDEALDAVYALKDKELKGRKLTINPARRIIKRRDNDNRRSGPPKFKE